MARPLGRILGRGSLFTVATAAPILASLLVTPLLTRTLPIAEYGRVSFALSIVNLAVSVLALGLPLVVVRQALTDGGSVRAARGLIQQGVALALGAGLLLAGITWFTLPDAYQTRAIVTLALVAGATGGAIAMCQSLAVAREQPLAYVATAFATGLLAPAAGLAATQSGSRSALSYLLGHVCVLLVTMAASFLLISTRPALRDSTAFATALKLALPLVPHQLAVTGNLALSVVIARLMLGEPASGRAQIALLLASAPLIVVSAMSYAWLPEVLKADPAHRAQLMASTARTITWLTGLAVSALVLLAPALVWFFAPRYGITEISATVAIAGLAAVVGTWFQAEMQIVLTLGTTGALSWLSPLALTVGALVGAGASRIIGLPGIGVGYLLCYVGLWAAARHCSRGMPWDRRPLFVVMLATGLLCLLGATLPAIGVAAGIRYVAAALTTLAGAGVYFHGLKATTSR